MKLREIRLSKNVKKVRERDIELKLDPRGFFLIRIKPKKREIEVGWCNYNYEITHIFIGKSVEKLYKTIIEEIGIENKQHLAYLGKELQRAKYCLDNNLKYIQE